MYPALPSKIHPERMQTPSWRRVTGRFSGHRRVLYWCLILFLVVYYVSLFRTGIDPKSLQATSASSPTKLKSQPQPEPQAEIKSKPKEQPEPKVEPEPKIELELESELESETETKIESKPESKTETKSKSKVEASTSKSNTNLSKLKVPEHKYAYAAFLAAPEEESENDNDDKYFVATRMVAYSLLHDPATRTNDSIPFIVLVTQDVTQRKRARLEDDGATIIEVGRLTIDWMKASRNRWRDVLSKMYLFTLTQYERILFMDSDMLIMAPMDDIFQDPSAELRKTGTNQDPVVVPSEEGEQPKEYAFGGVSGQGGYDHPFPPRKGGSCNAGFILFRPSMDLFHYYIRVMENGSTDKFNPNYPEQNLWNYVHRRKGNMPWQQINPVWNVNWATYSDYKKGVKTLHTKWWSPGPEYPLQEVANTLKWKMEGNSEGREASRANSRKKDDLK